MKILLSLLVVHGSAHAYPAPDVLRMVQDALRPGISVEEQATVNAPCEPVKADITGKDPITFQPRHVRATVYRPSSGTRTVLVLPPISGTNQVDRAYALDLCREGVRAAILEGWDFDREETLDLATYDRSALRMLAAAEHLLEYLQPAGSVGVLGTSLGAIEGAYLLGYDKRVEYGVLIVGGAGLPSIIAHTDEGKVAELRRRQMAALGITSVDEFEKMLRAAIRLDPSTFSDFSGPKRLRIYVGLRDTTVPTDSQLELARSFGAGDVQRIPADHIGTIGYAFLMDEGRTVRFLSNTESGF